MNLKKSGSESTSVSEEIVAYAQADLIRKVYQKEKQ